MRAGAGLRGANPDVFVSYRRTDRDFVERFVSVLEQRGPEVWWDAEIGAGDDWRDSIVQHLVDSDFLVIVFSEHCNTSKQLLKELAVADHLNKVVIPLKIDGAEPKGPYLYELAWRNWIDVHPDPISKMDTAVERIIDTLVETGWTHPGPPERDTGFAPPTIAEPTRVAVAPVFAPPTVHPAGPAPAPATAGADPNATDHPSVGMATAMATAESFRLRDAFPFHWLDFVAPVILFVLVVIGLASDGEYSLAVNLGAALLFAVMLLAAIGVVAFPIRYYRRRANPYRVARNLLVSSLTFSVGGALASLIAAEALADETDSANEVRVALSLSFVFYGFFFAAVSFVVFFALSKVRAKRELHANMETVRSGAST